MSSLSDVAGPGAEDGTGLGRDCLPGVQLTELFPPSPDLLVLPAITSIEGPVSHQADFPQSWEVVPR